jgi:hypothetical protein
MAPECAQTDPNNLAIKHQDSLVRSRVEATTDLGQYPMPEICAVLYGTKV